MSGRRRAWPAIREDSGCRSRGPSAVLEDSDVQVLEPFHIGALCTICAAIGPGGALLQIASTGALEPYTESCMEEVGRLMEACERLPDCYNQVLLSGSLRYCARLLKRMPTDDRTEHLRRKILEYTGFVRDLLESQDWFSDTPVRRLDLQMLEDRFELLEVEASDLGILPTLEEMTVEEFLDRP